MPNITAAQIISELGASVVGNIDPNLPLSSLTFNTSEVTPNSLFVAIVGTKVDSHNFISEAFQKGASLAVVSDPAALNNHPGIVVSDTRKALSKLSSLFMAHPSHDLKMIGVTGTNGKTTVHWMIYHALENLGLPAIRIGTIGYQAPGILEEGSLTTPDPLSVQQALRRGVDAGARAAVMEVSSHALHQSRVDHVEFDVGIFTNLTRDHLDYHFTMEDYFSSKELLFQLISTGIKETKSAVINCDDPYGARYVEFCAKLGLKLFTYGFDQSARIRVEKFEQNLHGSRFDLNFDGGRFQIEWSSIGVHNAYNFCAAYGALSALGLDPEKVVRALELAPAVPGRLEPVGSSKVGVYVDYAHTPDALENVLRTMRELTKGKVWVVFGCGGDRDRGKRPLMGAIASQLADVVVVTSDNPRTEDPKMIVADILGEGARVDHVLIDRREAIRFAVQGAEAGDVVLIAGKGHENYQIIGTKKTPFSDQDEVRRALKENS